MTEKQTDRWMQMTLACLGIVLLLVQHYYHSLVCLDICAWATCKSSCFSLNMRQLIWSYFVFCVTFLTFVIAQVRIARFYNEIRERPRGIKLAPLHINFVFVIEAYAACWIWLNVCICLSFPPTLSSSQGPESVPYTYSTLSIPFPLSPSYFR